jgi:spore coat polysaccharide biosynthesis predicted glycosyltransferase SpsG
MKQTAVEWLVSKLPQRMLNYLKEEIEQAREMEKQQIIDAVEWGNRKGYEEHRLTCINNEDEQYYNETFKSEQDNEQI